MSLQAKFRHGDPLMVEYTPSGGNVNNGDVVLLGNTTGLTTGIAHHDIVNNVQGDLAIGGAVYDVINLNNAANYARVYWDGSKITTVSTNMATFGFIVAGGGGGNNTVCQVRHFPYVV